MRSLVAASMMLAMLFGGNAAFANGTNGNTNSGAKKKVAPVHAKTVRITVNEDRFSPSTIEVEKGFPVTLLFTRTDKKACGSKVVFRSLKITKALPVGKEVAVVITPRKTGDIAFACGMGMHKGKIVVE